MSSEPFKTIHCLYKRLNRIKALLRMQSSDLSTSVDVFEVYSSRLKEFLTKVEHEYSKTNISQMLKVRLAAIQLALHCNHLVALVYSSLKLVDRISIGLIDAEMQSIENCLQTFAVFRLNDIMSLIYFRMMHLLARTYFDPLKKVNKAKQWIQSAERMYLELLSQQNGRKYYDCRELFSKSPILRATENGFEIIKRLFDENAELLLRMHQLENHQMDFVFQWLQTHQNHSNWRTKLLSTVPQLLEHGESKVAAYYLLIAMKLAREKDDPKIQSSIATSWMHYFFGIFDRSQTILQQHFAEDQHMISLKSFALKRIGRKPEKRDHEQSMARSKSMFNCFADSIALSADELRLCTNSLETIAGAKVLLRFSIEILRKSIDEVDFQQRPMDFIVHHYQMSDLLTIATILYENADECFNFQMQRFQHIRQLVQWLQDFCPDVFQSTAISFLNDLNEAILDLYAINYERILMYMNVDSNDRAHIRRQIKPKFTELRDMIQTNQNTLAEHPNTKFTHIT